MTGLSVQPADPRPASRRRGAANELRELLLGSTLVHARAHGDFYRERLAPFDPARIGLAELATLPLLTKRDLTDHYDDICRPPSFPAAIMYTSGTEGRELLVPVSHREIAAAERLLAKVDPFEGDSLPLTLSIARVGHGTQLFSAAGPSIPAHIAYGPDQLVALLGRRYDFPGVDRQITVVEANLLSHVKLIAMLKERGIDGRDFGLELVLTTGWYVTPFKRRLIEQFWGAPLLDRYGVTEVNGDAKQCPSCGLFHFDPFVIAETIDTGTQEPIEAGQGQLVLTGLFPFNQVAPKIRYLLGDLVAVDPAPVCGMAEPGYRFLGREKHSVALTGDAGKAYLLFAAEIADVIDDYAEAVRRQETGFLCFLAGLRAGSPPVVEIRVEWDGKGREDELARVIRAHSPTLDRAMSDGVCDLAVRLVAPGTLETIAKI